MSGILIIENDAAFREVLDLALTGEGYEVRTAPHGAAALVSLREHQPALILLDPHMPVMNGWEFVQVYHQAPGPHAAIIGLRTDTKPLGTNVELAMPFGLSEFLDLVGQHVSKGAA